MQNVQFSMLVILSLFSNVLAYEECSSRDTYCEDGYTCCEDDIKCCAESALAIGGIVGLVIGVIILISCCVGVICVVIKKRNRPGHPSQQTGVPSISTGQHHGPPIHGQPMYGQPSYGQPSYGQPQHGSQQTQGV